MHRVQDYRRNAQGCRDMAAHVPGEEGAKLLALGRLWDELADERERFLADRGLTDDVPAAPRS